MNDNFKDILVKKGLNEEQIEQALKEVGEVIQYKILDEIVKRFFPEDSEKLKSLKSADEIIAYFAANKEKVPKLDENEIEKISGEVWLDYINSI